MRYSPLLPLVTILAVLACEPSSPASFDGLPEKTEYEQVMEIMSARHDPDDMENVVDRLKSVLGRPADAQIRVAITLVHDLDAPSYTLVEDGSHKEASTTGLEMATAGDVWFVDEVCRFDSGGTVQEYNSYVRCAREYSDEEGCEERVESRLLTDENGNQYVVLEALVVECE